ncbi:hypothetical protein ABEB36_000772 [Hypothenemus hampei]
MNVGKPKCYNLKDQLDYMKHLYEVNKSLTVKSKKVSHMKNPFLNSTGCLDDNDDSKSVKDRQKSNQIGTDNTGAAVQTINNILNGITNSVNRLSEIHSQMTTPRVKMFTGAKDEATETKSTGRIPELKIESTGTVLPKSRTQKRNAIKSSGKIISQYALKKSVEKKIRSMVAKSNGNFDKKSSTVIKSRFLNKLNTKNNNLVEIYHNDAVKHSDSDESNVKKQQEERPKGEEEIPPLQIAETMKENHEFSCNNPFDSLYAPRTTVSCCYNKNYELPTVASKMKQVTRNYLGTLNLKTIPFCAAASTSQSHNIGINIQQVLNIIKNRHPISGISPTLAHNIGLAAEKVQNKPFSALVSTINSKIMQAAVRCPLSRTYLNIQQLQEQAKTIPEEIIEEVDEIEAEDSPETQTIIITGPSGDMEIKTKTVPTWSVETSASNDQCTCKTQPNVAFNQIARRYQRNIQTLTDNSLNSQIIDKPMSKRVRKINKNIKNKVASKESQVQTNNYETTLNEKEKNMKEVLTNLHHDFDLMNKTYEDLYRRNKVDPDDNSVKQLEKLEVEITKKEEEITMIMTLYKEVLALKDQVKQLKEKQSQSSLPSKDQNKAQFKEYNNPEAAYHLTKLLRQIQHYQMRYKSNLSKE